MNEPPNEPAELTDAERERVLAEIEQVTAQLRGSLEKGRREREAFRTRMQELRTELADDLRAAARPIMRTLLLEHFPDLELEIDAALAQLDAKRGQPTLDSTRAEEAPEQPEAGQGPLGRSLDDGGEDAPGKTPVNPTADQRNFGSIRLVLQGMAEELCKRCPDMRSDITWAFSIFDAACAERFAQQLAEKEALRPKRKKKHA